MLAIPYLLLSFLAALVIVQRCFREFPALVRIVGAFAVSIVLSSWLTFLAAWLIHLFGIDDATAYGAFVAMLVSAVTIALGWRELRPASFRVRPLEILGAGAALAVSFWVMKQRLSGDPLMVSANTWGDTALHVGIARSFSQADNYPPVLPIFSGETIRYHFGFDFYAGVLERLGLPIEWAFNLPGALGFAAIMVLVFAFAHYLWQRVSIGVLAAILFATNGSLAFLRYFDKYPSVPLALEPHNWWNLDKYLAIGPFQAGERISIFLTLNPYLTQTHLIISMVIVLFVGYGLLRHLRGPGSTGDRPHPLPWSRAVALGILSGASYWINGVLFGVSMVFLCVLFYLYSGRLRRMAIPSIILITASVAAFSIGAHLDSDGIRAAAIAVLLAGFVLMGPLRQALPFFATAGALALPQLLWLSGSGSVNRTLLFHDGYLVENFRFDNLGAYGDFVTYWWLNLGLVGPLVILAAIVCARADRKLLAAVMAIFVFGNLVVLGSDVGGHGHKVFNVWEVLVNLFAAYGLVWISRTLWNGLPAARRRLGLVAGRVLAVGVVPAACVVLVLSGFFDYMTLKNDPRYQVFGDSQPAISWIERHTPRHAVFLTAYGDVYTLPTLAGRSVYLGGFEIWAPAMGYADASRRKAIIAGIYQSPNLAIACQRLRGTGVDYLQVGRSEQDGRFQFTADLFPGEFVRVYSDNLLSYYDVKASCDERNLATRSGP